MLGATEEKDEDLYPKVGGVRAEILPGYLPNTSQKFQCLSQLA
jgi:hypothetical protein